VHGLNEYISVDSLMQDRQFMYRLVQMYAEQP
jgi:acetylornithine deacetylase/succinyl-diaminopimelate desuccinylase-like protein